MSIQVNGLCPPMIECPFDHQSFQCVCLANRKPPLTVGTRGLVSCKKPKTVMRLLVTMKRVVRRWEAELNADGKRQPPRWESDSDLPKRILDWIDARNVVVHKMVRSRPGTPTMQIDQFLALAKSAAEGGAILCREVSDWHRRQKTRSSSFADQSDE
jgi:hypothetical protein